MVSSIERFHCIQDSQLGPNDVFYRQVPLDKRSPLLASTNQGTPYEAVKLLSSLPFPSPHCLVSWQDLLQSTQERKALLAGAAEVHSFIREADDTMDRITDKVRTYIGK